MVHETNVADIEQMLFLAKKICYTSIGCKSCCFNENPNSGDCILGLLGRAKRREEQRAKGEN